jgi:NAD(P)-dependent dehydrogenase (short-subunit alcohol dehydrogenase family)
MDARPGEAFNRVAVVTGATSGLGREIAKELAQHGDRVVVVATGLR